MSTSFARIAASCDESFSGTQRSSALRKARYSPWASAAPRFIAEPGPPFGWLDISQGIPEALRHGGRAVGGAVVHHDDLRLPVSLRKHAFDGVGEVGLAVVDRDDDGDRHAGTRAAASRSVCARASPRFSSRASITSGTSRRSGPSRSL